MDVIKAAIDGEGGEACTGGVKHAVVTGAGYIGLAMAENLHERGVSVEIVVMADQIMPPLDRELTKKDNTFIDTDLVIMAAGVRPSRGLAVSAGLELRPRGGIKVDRHMRTSDPDIYAARDAVEVEVEVEHTVLPGTWRIRLAGRANRQGRVAAEKICGRDTVFESTQGTSIVKVFDVVAGGTGASESAGPRTLGHVPHAQRDDAVRRRAPEAVHAQDAGRRHTAHEEGHEGPQGPEPD